MRFDELAQKDLPVNLYATFKSVTMDIVSEMVFGYSFDVMDSPNFQHPHLDALHEAVQKAWIFRTFPKLGWLSLNLPEWISSSLMPVPIVEFGKVRSIVTGQNFTTRLIDCAVDSVGMSRAH